MSRVKVNLGVKWMDLPAQDRRAFRGGTAEKVLLPVGTRLYKFNHFSTLHGPDAGAAYRPVSPWWSPYQLYRHDPGWHAKLRIARHLDVSVREWGRITSAVKENWNSLQHLLVIVLKHDVYAFWGGFAQQVSIDAGAGSLAVTQSNAAGFVPEAKLHSRFTTATGRVKQLTRENLAGGGTQFFIPNLRAANIRHWYSQSLLNA